MEEKKKEEDETKEKHESKLMKKAEASMAQLKKTSPWKIILFILFTAGVVVSFVFSPYIFGENSWFYTFQNEIEIFVWLVRAIPPLIRSIQVIIISALVYSLIVFIMKKSVRKTNRSVTIVKLISSFLKWVVVIVAFLCVLGAWGVDVVTLVAGAGILTLVIGLGAQSLISDIIAGVFIVVEGGFQIGDVVSIDDWRGTVQEIGIRTTKLIDAGGDIRVINNSQIKAFTNKSKELSVAKVFVGIEYGESIPRVEKIVQENLPKIKEKIPAIVEGPNYLGVDSLGDSSVLLFFNAQCKEDDLYQVQRDLNREVKLLFDANGIAIPFPQVTLNERKEK